MADVLEAGACTVTPLEPKSYRIIVPQTVEEHHDFQVSCNSIPGYRLDDRWLIACMRTYLAPLTLGPFLLTRELAPRASPMRRRNP